MSDTQSNGGMSCTMICWIVAAVIGIVLFLILTGGLGMGTFLAIILTLIAFGLLGWWLSNTFCTGAEATQAATQPAATAATASAAAPEAAAAVSEAPAEDVAPEAAAAVSEAPAEVAEAPAPAAEAPAATPAAAAAPVVASSLLAGESELASRKGSWSYTASGSEAPAAAPAADPAPAAAPATEDYDGDGILEGTDEGTRPATLDGPREGGADDLKQIKGVGPKMETMLNTMGFYHFDQVAAWSDDEVAWVDANLEGFKGRVSRDSWVEQARVLATGGETEFSKRVEGGDVY